MPDDSAHARVIKVREQLADAERALDYALEVGAGARAMTKIWLVEACRRELEAALAVQANQEQDPTVR